MVVPSSTIFPRCWFDSMYALASASWSNGKTRSMSGRICPTAKSGMKSATKAGTPAARCSGVRILFDTPKSVRRLACSAWMSISP